jgi:hypothetical protein
VPHEARGALLLTWLCLVAAKLWVPRFSRDFDLMITRREFLQRTTAAGLAAAASFRISHAAQANTSNGAPNISGGGQVLRESPKSDPYLSRREMHTPTER